jgi:hypothetical protein
VDILAVLADLEGGWGTGTDDYEGCMTCGFLSNLLLREGGKGDGRATPGPASFLHSEKVVRDAKSGGKLIF